MLDWVEARRYRGGEERETAVGPRLVLGSVSTLRRRFFSSTRRRSSIMRCTLPFRERAFERADPISSTLCVTQEGQEDARMLGAADKQKPLRTKKSSGALFLSD